MKSKTPRAHPKKIMQDGKVRIIARIKLPFGNGNYLYRTLGPWGEHYDSETRIIAEWKASLQSGTLGLQNQTLKVMDLLDRYLKYAEEYYKARPIGENDKRKVGGHYAHVIKALKYPWRLYREMPAEEFGPLALEACREVMIDDNLSRKYVNKLVDCIRRTWKWASSKQLVSSQCFKWLMTVNHLKRGRTRAKEGRGTPPIVPWDDIQKTVVNTSRTIGAMILTQYYCCMRPEEVCIMRKRNIHLDVQVEGLNQTMWGYYPDAYKGDHLDQTSIQEVIPIGPKAQAILQPFLNEAKDENDYLFSPANAQAEELALKRSLRKTKVQPSQLNRRKKKPEKQPGPHYMPGSYCQAVKRAIKRAGVPKWTPVQLRHSHATDIREKHDSIDAAQLSLRHKHAKTSEIYAKLQVRKAFQLMAKEG